MRTKFCEHCNSRLYSYSCTICGALSSPQPHADLRDDGWRMLKPEDSQLAPVAVCAGCITGALQGNTEAAKAVAFLTCCTVRRTTPAKTIVWALEAEGQYIGTSYEAGDTRVHVIYERNAARLEGRVECAGAIDEEQALKKATIVLRLYSHEWGQNHDEEVFVKPWVPAHRG